jgi:hypothetical protein
MLSCLDARERRPTEIVSDPACRAGLNAGLALLRPRRTARPISSNGERPEAYVVKAETSDNCKDQLQIRDSIWCVPAAIASTASAQPMTRRPPRISGPSR